MGLKNIIQEAELCLYLKGYILLLNIYKQAYFSYLVRLSRAGKYVPEEDEISMGRVSSIVTPKYEERQVMREYYS